MLSQWGLLVAFVTSVCCVFKRARFKSKYKRCFRSLLVPPTLKRTCKSMLIQSSDSLKKKAEWKRERTRSGDFFLFCLRSASDTIVGHQTPPATIKSSSTQASGCCWLAHTHSTWVCKFFLTMTTILQTIFPPPKDTQIPAKFKSRAQMITSFSACGSECCPACCSCRTQTESFQAKTLLTSSSCANSFDLLLGANIKIEIKQQSAGRHRFFRRWLGF